MGDSPSGSVSSAPTGRSASPATAVGSQSAAWIRPLKTSPCAAAGRPAQKRKPTPFVPPSHMEHLDLQATIAQKTCIFECISTSMPKQEKSLKPRLSTVDPNNSHTSVFEGIGFTTHPLRGQLLCPVVLHSVVGPPLSVVMMKSASSYLNRCTDRVRRQLCAGFQLRLRWDNRRIHCRAFLQRRRNI